MARVTPDLQPGELLDALASGYPLGWTTRYQLIVVPMLSMVMMSVLFLPYTFASILVFVAMTVIGGFLLYVLSNWLKPVGVAPLRGNTTIALAATDRRLLVYVNGGRHRHLAVDLPLDDIDDAVLQRALVGISRGGVITVTCKDGSRLMVEAPGLSQIDDLALVVDSIR